MNWQSVIREGALVAALMSIEGEWLPIDPRAVTGTATSTSTATGTLSVSGVTIEVDGDTSFVQHLEAPRYPELATLLGIEESNERLPINPVAFSGTATSTSTATGTLSVSALPIDVAGDTAVAQDIAPPLYPEFATLQGAEETERVPVSAVALSGTATSTSTATGTLGVAALPIDVSADTDIADKLPPAEWHGPYPEHDPTFAPVALSGTATSTSTATGTLSVSGVTIEPTDHVPLEGPDQDATTAILMAADGEVIPVSGSVEAPPAGDAAPLEDDSAEVALSLAPPEYHGPYPEHELPINPRAITGTATSTSTATGTLSNAGVNLDVSGDTAVAPFLAPDRDAATAIYQASLDAESIPVSGTVTGVPGNATLSDVAPAATLSDTSPTASISDSPAPTATLSDSAPTAELSDSAPTATLSDAIP